MADIFRGRIIDVTEKSRYTIELTGDAGKLDAFIGGHRPRRHPRNRAHRHQRDRSRRAHPARLISAFQQSAKWEIFSLRERKVLPTKTPTSPHQGQERHHHRLRLAGPRHARTSTTAASRSPSACAKGRLVGQGREGRPEGGRGRRGRQGADVVMILLPDEQIAAVYKNDVEPNIKQGRVAGLRARLQRALRPGRAARRPRRRGWSRPRPRPHRALDLHPGGGVPPPDRRAPDKSGKARDLALSYAAAPTAAARPASSRPTSARRPRPTCSASRPCCAAAPSS